MTSKFIKINREEYNAYQREYWRERYNTDPVYREKVLKRNRERQYKKRLEKRKETK